jgi:hypothetical protein
MPRWFNRALQPDPLTLALDVSFRYRDLVTMPSSQLVASPYVERSENRAAFRGAEPPGAFHGTHLPTRQLSDRFIIVQFVSL